jgi:alpha-L-rhamnosidase
MKKTRISWKIQSDFRGTMQKAYHIQVIANCKDFKDLLWDIGIVQSSESIHIEYGGPEITRWKRAV